MKKMILVGAMVLGVGVLGGCSEPVLKYKGEKMPASELQEVIENELEIENRVDLDVVITVDEDDMDKVETVKKKESK